MADVQIISDYASGTATQAGGAVQAGVSSTGAVLTDRESLSEHYRSDFHRYNLKRKVAGLPPVTREWFEARKAQLASAQASISASVPSGCIRVWFDPLTRKTFHNEQTWQSHVRSNKYLELVRKSGQPAPPAIISIKKLNEAADNNAASPSPALSNRAAPTPAQQQQQQGPGFKVVMPSGGLRLKQGKADAGSDDDDDDGGWETVSEEDEEEADAVAELAGAAAVTSPGTAMERARARHSAAEDAQGSGDEAWEDWDLCCSLFDNQQSKSFEANLEYMWRTFGFYLPDAEYLTDPEGLVRYLGAKIKYGHVPLYTRGDDTAAKQFRSLHAVQRHMVDSGRCKMVYEDNEEEYAEFYDYSAQDEEARDGEAANNAAGSRALVTSGDADAAAALISTGYELHVPGASGSGGKILGSREFARYYKQKHRAPDERQIVVVNTMLARYRALGISLRDEAVSLEQKKAKSKNSTDDKWASKRDIGLVMRSNIIRNLPKNVPY